MLPRLVTEVPGPHSRKLAEKLARFESRNITNNNAIFWERASGSNVWDVDGNCFLDLNSAFGASSLGHSHPDIRAALVRQSEDLMHAMGDVYPAAIKAEFCARLSELTFERWGVGAGKTILGNSGFEAVEAALKTSLLHSGKPGVIAFSGAYNGLGYGALEAGGLPFFRDPFRTQLKDFATILPYPHCYRCPFGVKEPFRLGGDLFPNCASTCLSELSDQITKTIRRREIGCILVEPVQGRGGQIVPPLDFMRLLRHICDEEKILLIADEIYTGLNRTGSLFACDHFEIVPDIVCLGKSLTSAFPISACIGRADVMDAWPESHGEALHTSTFLGNPLGCAMALASLQIHCDPAVAARVRTLGSRLKTDLKKIVSSRIGNVRGIGLLLGIEIVTESGEPDGVLASAIISAALRDGVLLLSDGPDANVIAIAPPFVISDAEIEFALDRLQEYCTSLPGSIS